MVGSTSSSLTDASSVVGISVSPVGIVISDSLLLVTDFPASFITPVNEMPVLVFLYDSSILLTRSTSIVATSPPNNAVLDSSSNAASIAITRIWRTVTPPFCIPYLYRFN